MPPVSAATSRSQPLDIDIDLQMTRFTSLVPAGLIELIPVLRLNGFYRFHDATRDMVEFNRYIKDPLYLVATFNLHDLAHWFNSFTVTDMKKCLFLHGVGSIRGKKEDYRRSLLEHECKPVCVPIVYVFKCLSKERYGVLSRFSGVMAKFPRGESGSFQALSMLSSVDQCVSGATDTINFDDDSGRNTEYLSPVDLERKGNIIKKWEGETTTERLKLFVCAPCAKRIAMDDSVWVDGNGLDLTLLRNNNLPDSLRPCDYNFHAYGQALLNHKGLERTDCVGYMRVCNRCIRYLRDGRMPKFALCNWLYYGYNVLPPDVKRAFDESSLFDRMLICRARSNSICCRFNASGNSKIENDVPSSRRDILSGLRKGVRGNVMVAPLDVVRMNKLIPPASDVVKDTMCAIFVSDTLPTKSTIRKFSPILVRKSRVKSMIQFLLRFNKHYAADDNFVGFSQRNLDSLFGSEYVDEGVPNTVSIGQIPSNDAISNGTSDYTLRNVDGLQASEVDELLMENVGYTDGDDSPLGYRNMKNIALERCLQGKPFIASGTGSTVIQDFHNPSTLTWLFPHLDPWGIGGFNHPSRVTKISMEEQLKHLLLIDDSPFERDPEFAFVFYNVVQKLKVVTSLRFSVPYTTHRRIVSDLLTIDPDIFIQLNRECERDPYYRPANDAQKKALSLLASIGMIARHVPGSNGYKIAMRNQIRALIHSRGTPTLFITLNPSDVDNPIVRLYTGEDISLEDVARGEDMSEWKRKVLAARNPVACALFFDLMITKFIKIVLGYGENEPGLYGKCEAYYGTVEAQGKGTLHCHMLVWLQGHLSPQKMRDNMAISEAYKHDMFAWLESVIKCEFPGDGDSQPLRRVRAKDLGNPHPGTIPSPSLLRASSEDGFWEDFRYNLTQLLNEYNYHEHQATCWKYLARGQAKSDSSCRMGMDGKTRDTTCLDAESLSILLRRRHPWIASYSDVLTFLMKCNSDIKFVGSGDAAKSFLFYITDYITKPTLQVHVGMAALTYAVKKTYSRFPEINVDAEPKDVLSAVTIAVNSMMGRHEISHAQVMSYLVGGGDHYTSEKFAVMQWGLVSRYVQSVWNQYVDQHPAEHDIPMKVGVNINKRQISATNQQIDYTFRSKTDEYESLCLYDFVSYVTKVKINRNNINVTNGAGPSGLFCSSGHPQFETHRLKISKSRHVPVLLGPSILNPNRSSEAKDLWARDILILFKPWRDPLDLKDKDETWLHAYEAYESLISSHNSSIVRNINVLNECKEARDIYRSRRNVGVQTVIQAESTTLEYLQEPMMDKSAWPEDILDDAGWPKEDGPFMSGVKCSDILNREPLSVDSRLGEILGYDVVSNLNMCLSLDLRDSSSTGNIRALHDNATHTTKTDAVRLSEYAAIMTSKRKRACTDDDDDPEDDQTPKRKIAKVADGIVERAVLKDDVWRLRASSQMLYEVDRVVQEMSLYSNPDQLRAFDIIAQHAIIGGDTQLLMYVAGVGGTGKSHLIKAIVKLFERLRRRKHLILGAPTGIAATLIGGHTLHSLILATPNNKSKDIEGLCALWRSVRYLIVDEVSMVGAQFLSNLSARMRQAKAGNGIMSDKPFGGVSVIFMGDFGQLKPPKQTALYSYELVRSPSFAQSRNEQGIGSMNGAVLWRQVTTVVHLMKNQRHESDKIYADFLSRLRIGACLDDGAGNNDLDYLKSRLISNILVKNPEELSEFWDAPIIVGSKLLRDKLNDKMVAYHATRQSQTVHAYYSRDTVNRTLVATGVRNRLWNLPSKIHQDSFGRLPMFPGMKVMITENIAFDNGIVNGTEGILKDINYEEDEDGRRYATVAYVLIEGCGIRIPGLPDDIVPLFPVAKRLIVTEPDLVGQLKAKGFTRRQLPLLPAYAYTDFKSQGRTLIRAMIDPMTARGQGVYVMLSRVKSLSGIAILRWFPPTRIYRRLPADLREELSRLEGLDDVLHKTSIN